MTRVTPLPELRTPRLVLRAPDEGDIPAWFARATDVQAAALSGDPIPDSIAAGADWLERSRQRLAAGQALQWSIDRPGIAQSIGTITLRTHHGDATADLGFVLGRDHWGQGLATEAAGAVLRFALGPLGLRQVRAELVTRNLASLRVLEKLGFRRVETFTDPSDGEECLRLILP